MFRSFGGHSKPTVVISDRAYAEIINETLQNIRTETGGILLGLRNGDKWHVIESLDPGPNSIYQSAFFQYDDRYVTHLANKVRLRYMADLRLIGLWHRHPGSFDRFSRTDDGTNTAYVKVCGGTSISGLVNIDPDFRTTFYVASGDPVQYERADVMIGDECIPQEILQMRDSQGLLKSIAALTSKMSSAAISHQQSPQSILPISSAREESVRVAAGEIQRLVTGARFEELGHEETHKVLGNPPQNQPLTRETHDAVMDMVMCELEYLDKQGEYSYELSPEGGGVHLVLIRATSFRECPDRLDFLFANTLDGPSVIRKSERHSFRPGITRILVNEAISLFAERRL